MDVATISILCTAVGCALGVLSYGRLKGKDAEDDGFTKAKLESISIGVDSIRVDIKSQGEKLNSINERLIRVEERSKSNTHRLDKLEGIEGDDKND